MTLLESIAICLWYRDERSALPRSGTVEAEAHETALNAVRDSAIIAHSSFLLERIADDHLPRQTMKIDPASVIRDALAVTADRHRQYATTCRGSRNEALGPSIIDAEAQAIACELVSDWIGKGIITVVGP
jgi:hypothetical protein